MGHFPAKKLGRHGRVFMHAPTVRYCLGLLCLLAWLPLSAAPVQVTGNFALLGDDMGQLKTVSLGTGTNIAGVFTNTQVSGISGIALHEHYASVSVTNEGLFIFDLSSTPPALVPGGRFTYSGEVTDVKVAGRVAYLANDSSDIGVVDLFDAGNPIGLPMLMATGSVVSIDIVSNRLYAACSEDGLLIMDISNPIESTHLGHRATSHAAHRVRVAGNYAYVLCEDGRLEIINIQNPANPTLAGTYQTSGELTDVDVRGNHAIVANTNGTVTLLNVSNPGSVAVVGSQTVAGGAWGICLSGANAYVRNHAGNLVVLTFAALPASAPQLREAVAAQQVATGQPVVLSVLATGSTPLTFRWSRNGIPLVNDARITGTTNAWLSISAAIPGDAGVYSVTVSNALGQLVSSNVLTVVSPGTPVWRSSFNLGGGAENLDVYNSIVSVAAGDLGLEIFSTTSPRFPYLTGGNTNYGHATGVRMSETHIYLAATTNGLQVFSGSIYGDSQLLTATNTPGTACGVYLANGLAYVADGENGLEIYRLNSTNLPTWLGAYDTAGYARNVYVADGLAFVADGTNGVEILSVTNPAAVVRLGGYDTAGEARNVKAISGRAYVADGAGGFLVLDVSNPATPTLLGSRLDAVPALDLDIALGTAVLALGSNGLHSLSITNPAAITTIGSYPLASARGVRLQGNFAYVAAGANGVQIFELLGIATSYPDVSVTPIEFVTLPDGSVTFQATATGDQPLTYQWYKGNVPLFNHADAQGTGTPDLALTHLMISDSGEYRVVVRNAWNLTASAQAQLHVVPPGTPVLSGGYFNTGDSLNLHVIGNLAYVASRLSGLEVVDCHDPSNPVLLGQHATLGLAQDVRVKGRYAYVASWDAGLEIFDVINPTNLVRVGHCDTPGFAHAVRVAGDYAHVANRSGGYTIIDIRNPAQPTIAGAATTQGFAEGLTVLNQHALVASSQAGMEVFTVNDPLSPTRVAQLDTPDNAENITVSGTHAYIADYYRGVSVVDVSNPTAPTPITQFQTPGDAFHVQIVGTRAYIAQGIGKIQMADISNPAQPTHISTSLAGSSVRSLQIIGRHAFVADRTEGFVVADLLGLDSVPPSIVDLTPNTTNLAGNGLVLSVAAEGTPPLSYAWFQNGLPVTNSTTISGANDPHLQFPNLAATNAGNYTVIITNAVGSITSAVVTVTIPPQGTPFARGTLDTPGQASATAVFGNIAYIADGTGGLRLVDLSNPDSPVALGTYAPTGNVFGVFLQTNLLYLALGSNGIAILDVSEPTQPAFVSAFDTPGTALNLDVTNGHAFIADGEGGLLILSVTNPAAPVSLGTVPTSGSTHDVRVSGGLVFAAEGTGGLKIISATNPTLPVVIGSHASPGSANAVRLANNRAYVANGSAGLLILDVQNPALPQPLGSYPATNAIALDLVGHLVVLADGANGYFILDATNPASIALIATVNSATANGVLIAGNIVFHSSGTEGVRLTELFGVPPAAPAFLAQPVSTSVLYGGFAEFRATPTGTPPLTYRWYHNDLPVFDDWHTTGAAATRLTVSNVAFADAGNYQLRILGPAGVTNSASAKLTFIGPLQAQLNAATNGAVIQLPAGTVTENLILDRDLTLIGTWWNQPVLSGGFVGPALQVLPGTTVTLQGVALCNGFSFAAGGGILNEGTLTLDRCLIANNAAVSGGGIANLGTLHVYQSVISNNAAATFGGGLYNGPTATAFLTNSVVVANEAETGGALFNLGTNALVNSLLARNLAQGNPGLGGGLRQSFGLGHLINTTLSGNTTASWDSENDTAAGGGAHVDGGRLELLFTTVANNSATAHGGGISASGAAEVRARNSVFASNLAAVAPDFEGTLHSEGYNLIQETSAELDIVGTTTGNQLNTDARLQPLADNGGPTRTHAPAADSPLIDAGAPPGPSTDARGIARPFDLPWKDNTTTSWDLGAMESVNTALYLTLSNRTPAGFTLAWPDRAVLQKSESSLTGWVDQTNVSPLFVATTNSQAFFRLQAPLVPIRLTTNNETTNGFDLAWPDFGILEHAPTPDGPWEVLTGSGPFHIQIVPGANEFFRLRVIQD